MADILDILELDRDGDKKILKKKRLAEPTFKKPEGMNREVYALLCADNKDKSPLIQTDFAISSKLGFPAYGYKKVKANLSLRKVRKWSWMAFTNPARKDGFQLYHWRREVDKNREYPFSKMNVSANVPSYTDSEYQELLQNEAWTKGETDYLFRMCRKFDLRFLVIEDRWDRVTYAKRSVEDIKDRYYTVCGLLTKARIESGCTEFTKHPICVFDADHERKRKEQLNKLYNRTPEEVEEEQHLISELRKIEQRKKERDKKTQDVQNLLTAADNTAEQRRNEQPRSAAPIASRSSRKKTNPQVKGTRTSDLSTIGLNTANIESAGIKFPESKTSGVWLLSSRMKLPSSVGQKRMKAIDQLLKELEVEEHPMPHPDICQNFNELRSDMVLLYELKTALASIEFEQQSLKHQLDASSMPSTSSSATDKPPQTPGTPFTDPSFSHNLTPALQTPSSSSASSEMKTPSTTNKGESGAVKKISEVIDVASPRKRKAALEQVNLMKKLIK